MTRSRSESHIPLYNFPMIAALYGNVYFTQKRGAAGQWRALAVPV
jgi:hypothetical protein